MRAHQLRALMRVRHRVAAACVRANSAHSRECPIVSRCSGLRAGQLRVLMRMRYLIALQRTVFGSTPRTYTTAPSYRVSAACVQASSAHSHECPIALQRHARTPTPRTYANAPSYRVSAAGVWANSAHLRECAIALQRHARAPTPRTYASAPSRCSGMRTGQLRALTRMCHRVSAACAHQPDMPSPGRSGMRAIRFAHGIQPPALSARICTMRISLSSFCA